MPPVIKIVLLIKNSEFKFYRDKLCFNIIQILWLKQNLCESVVEKQTYSWIGRIFTQLIHIYLFVCQTYNNCSESRFHRPNNNREPPFTNREITTIWFFAHLNGASNILKEKQGSSFCKKAPALFSRIYASFRKRWSSIRFILLKYIENWIFHML